MLKPSHVTVGTISSISWGSGNYPSIDELGNSIIK